MFKFVAGVNAPVPEEDQTGVAGNPIIAPDKITVLLFAHTVGLSPAFGIGGFCKNTTTLPVPAKQPWLFVEVKVKVTLPAAISAALGK